MFMLLFYLFFLIILAPTCSPTLESASAISSTSIRATWTPFPNTMCRNGILRGYNVAYKQRQKGTTKYQNVRGIGAITTVVTDLDKYTEYNFQVLAYTIK